MFERTILAAAIAALALATSVQAQTVSGNIATAPGAAAMSRTVRAQATITAIDAGARAVTLRGPQGRELQITAGPEVKNFAQLKVGDQVELQYTEALLLELVKGGGKAVAKTSAEAGATAKAGGAPGAIAGRRITVVGDVIAVDAATQMVTVKGPQRTATFHVADTERFKRIAKGDQIEATYAEAVAVAVTPVAK